MGSNSEEAQPHRPRRAKHQPEPPVPAPAAGKKKAPPERRRRRRRIALFSLAAITVLVIAAVAVAGTYLHQLSSTFNENRNVIDELDLQDDTAYRTPEGTINILLLGTDSRGDVESEYRSRIGEEGERSDTMMFVHIPADRSEVYVMSIMRDLWVEVPGEGMGRVNSALSAGGYELAVDMVEELLYTHIDHVAVIDFEGFAGLTEALGGVYVDNPRSFSAGQRNPDFYPEGTIRLEGSNALRFVRERKSFPMGDYVRVQNQQLVVRAIVERFLSGDTLTNPQRVMSVVEEIVPYLEVDSALDAETIAGYAMDMHQLRGSDIHMFTIPTGEHTVTSGGAQVILPDEELMALLQRSLKNDNLSGFLEHYERLDGEMLDDSFTGEETDAPESDEDDPESLLDGTAPENVQPDDLEQLDESAEGTP
ncbi:LCP family protein [Nesterenkonia flava]|uniref:LCP family protein n=1 Tax=Nesterenkonia flava TaxID=469799 RepID=A0ABU1FRQ8_9MICC|nr:LCP family protein [Nesterenkonia flava]MDR5711339.1 LCP family protein [Nesterenkonia flava]